MHAGAILLRHLILMMRGKKHFKKAKQKKTGEATCPLSGCSSPSVSISKGFWKVIGRIMISTHLTRFSRVQLNCLTGLSPTKLGI